MEVTRNNFESVLSNLPEIIENAQFFTIDTEFTGLKIVGGTNINYFDTLEDVYFKFKQIAETFMAIQIGLVAYFYEEETKKYTHVAFNFYIYPSSHNDLNFTCESRSIKFLSDCGFDFNKLFKDGIPYLRQEEVDTLIKKLDEKQEKNYSVDNSMKMSIPEDHKETISGILEKINKISESDEKADFKTERYNSYIRKLIYNNVFQEYGSTVLLESNADETITVSVGYSPEEIKGKQEETLSNKKKEINLEFGFSNVIKMLIESKKLIIGHNFLLDIMFIIRQFCAPLPDTYSEFKELVVFLFPKIIDTKYMATSVMKDVKDTSLSNLQVYLEKINAVPEVSVNENGIGCNVTDNKYHEASFDAYLTGLCFLAMAKCLGNANCVTNIYNSLPDSPVLDSVLNKLAIPKLYGIFCINLQGPDVEPDRTGLYHLTFPKEWTRENINDLFSNCGFVQIGWINSTSAFVKVKKEHVQEADHYLNKSNTNYKLITYKEFKTSNSNNSNLLLSPLLETGRQDNIVKTSQTCDSPFGSTSNESVKRRKYEEDIGEVIERPKKKLCSSN